MIPNREAFLRKAASIERWDIIVIGGGATGLGTALDAASRGYSTLLLESHDFGKGTSSKSTKLIHGGVRYLRQGNVKMVMKALRERGRLLKNAPHVVHPLQFVVPCYKWWHKPWYGIGMKVYDALARSLGIGPSTFLNREETLKLVPGLHSEGLRGAVTYWDGQFDDTRLLVSLAQTAVEKRAALLNYFPVTGLVESNGRITGVEATDSETGTAYTFRARVVINATGIFTDSIRKMDDHGIKPMMQAAQGIHIVLEDSFLSQDTALMVPDTDDGRVVFGVPWHGKVLFGTTDTPLEQIENEPLARESEIDYLLEHASRYFSQAPKRKDILSVYAGLRPLVKANKETKSISRDHTLIVSKKKLVTITGGKWTTYRQMAEDAVNRAEKTAKMEKRVCLTRNLLLQDPHTFEYDESEAVIQPSASHRAESPLIHPELPYTEYDVRRAVSHEWARTVEDVLARRTRSLFLNAEAAVQAATRTAEIMGQELDWTQEKRNQEVDRFAETAKKYRVNDDG